MEWGGGEEAREYGVKAGGDAMAVDHEAGWGG